MADIVAKVPKGGGANFPPNSKTSNNRRPIGLQTRYQTRLCVLRLATWSPRIINRCTYGSENLSPTSQKTLQQYLPLPEIADLIRHIVGAGNYRRGNGEAKAARSCLRHIPTRYRPRYSLRTFRSSSSSLSRCRLRSLLGSHRCIQRSTHRHRPRRI